MTAPLSWINKGKNDQPDWLKPHAATKREPNGTFMLWTTVGKDRVKVRVLVGNIVVLRGEVAVTCPAGEVREYLADLDRMEQPVPSPGPHRPMGEADVADRTDDTDDISRRINGVKAPGEDAIAWANRMADEVAASPSKPLPPERQKAFKERMAAPKPKPAVRKQPYPAPLGRRPMIEWIPPAELTIDDAYQRTTENQASQALIRRIAANFDWRLCTPLIVSRRADGRFVVIDGQHRTLAAKLRGMDDLPCCVFTYDSPEEEAKMFIAANRQRKPMNRLDDFHAAMAAADSEALAIHGIVAGAGLTIARNTASAAWKPGEIAFTASIASTVRKHGADIASRTLRHIAEAFPDQKVVHCGSIFLGLVKVMTSPPAEFDEDRMFQALLRYSAEEWGSFVAGLKGGDTRATAIRDALLMAYEEVQPEERVA